MQWKWPYSHSTIWTLRNFRCAIRAVKHHWVHSGWSNVFVTPSCSLEASPVSLQIHLVLLNQPFKVADFTHAERSISNLTYVQKTDSELICRLYYRALFESQKDGVTSFWRWSNSMIWFMEDGVTDWKDGVTDSRDGVTDYKFSCLHVIQMFRCSDWSILMLTMS